MFPGWAVPCSVCRFSRLLLPLPELTFSGPLGELHLKTEHGERESAVINIGTTLIWTILLRIAINSGSCHVRSLGRCTTELFFDLVIFLHSSQLSKPVQQCLTNNNSTYRHVPCGTIKIPSESSICLPAMPAVSRPSWATSVPLLQYIIHEPPNSAEDSPGDSDPAMQNCTGGDVVHQSGRH